MLIESKANESGRTLSESNRHLESLDIFELSESDSSPSPSPVPDSPSRTAYSIYTSGTTGRPKGILVGCGSFSTAVTAAVNALGLGRNTRALCVSPFHFDSSSATLFSTLIAGGSIMSCDRGTH